MARPSQRIQLRWIFGVATGLATFSTSIAFVYVANYARFKTPLPVLVGLNFTYWYSWALLVPAILWLARRYPFERDNCGRAVAAHLPGVLVFTVLHALLATVGRETTMLMLSERDLSFWPAFRERFLLNFDYEMMTYWFLVGLTHAFDYRRQSEEQALTAAQLQARLAQAQLHTLQRQLHPHFLFNTLHTISALIHRDADAADAMLTRLSDLLRLTLNRVGTHRLTLKEELDFIDKYLEIEHTRFGDRLQVKFEVDPSTLDAAVPSLVLQPIVENALRHGIAPKVGGGRIDIAAQMDGEWLRLVVCDNGYGVPADSFDVLNQGVGVSNTRARLQHLYGDRHRFEFTTPQGGGLAVTIAIPFVLLAETADAPLEIVA